MADPEHDVPEDDGPSPLDADGATPFGSGPFGEGPFGPKEEDEEDQTPVTPPDEPGVTILQRHKVDRLLTGYHVSRERYANYKRKWAQDALMAERELKRKKRIEDRDLGERKIEYDKYRLNVLDGINAFESMMLDIERKSAAKFASRMRGHMAEIAARHQDAADFSRRQAQVAHHAQSHQFMKDVAEEQEALELLMMLDE